MSSVLSDVVSGATVTVSITPSGDPFLFTLTETFTLDILDPCLNTVLDPLPSFSLPVSELGVASSTTLAPVEDSSSRLNSGDGVTLCGPRVYTILSPATAWPTTVTLIQSGADGRTLTLESTDNTDAGTYAI